MADNLFIPADPLSIPFRPLNKGMITTISTLGLPDGSLFDIRNAQMNANGPRSVSEWLSLSTLVPYLWPAEEIPQRIEHLTLSSGSIVSVLVTNKALYEFEYTTLALEITPVFMANTPVAETLVTKTVTLASNADIVIKGIESGDMVTFSLTTPAYYEIDSVTDGRTIVLVTAPANLPANPVAHFVKKFKPEGGYMVSSATITRSGIAFSLYVDGPRGGIWKFDGALSKYTIVNESDSSQINVARSVSFFRDMFYFAGVNDGAAFMPFRIVWTSVLDPAEVRTTSYIDMPPQIGEITRLLPFGAQILSVHKDGLGLGRQTNLIGLPYMFTQMDTGGVVPIDPEACAVFLENLVYVSKDNIYLIDQNAGFKAIGDQISPTIRSLVARSNSSGLGVLALADSGREQLLFCFPDGSEYTNIIAYNYRTGAYSFFNETSARMVSVSTIGDVITMDEMTGKINTMDQLFYLMTGNKESRRLMRIRGNVVAIYDFDPEAAVSSSPMLIETGDIDFNEPDSDKSLLRIGLKVNDSIVPQTRIMPLKFLVEVSVDRSKVWQTVDELQIDPDKTEDTATCRIFGSHFRLRFTQVFDSVTGSSCYPFEVNEIILRVRKRSIEAVAAG